MLFILLYSTHADNEWLYLTLGTQSLHLLFLRLHDHLHPFETLRAPTHHFRCLLSYLLYPTLEDFQKLSMSPPSEQANSLVNQFTSTLHISGKENGDMTLAVLGCGEYVPIHTISLVIALSLMQD